MATKASKKEFYKDVDEMFVEIDKKGRTRNQIKKAELTRNDQGQNKSLNLEILKKNKKKENIKETREEEVVIEERHTEEHDESINIKESQSNENQEHQKLKRTEKEARKPEEKESKQKEKESEREFMRNTKGRLDDGNNLVVYIKGVNRNITRVNANRVQKEIFEILQRHVNMEKAGESLRIFCKNEKEKARMLAQKDIADNEVKVTEPYTRLRTHYTPRGIIIDVDLDMEDEEIRAATSAVTAKRIEKMVAGQEQEQDRRS